MKKEDDSMFTIELAIDEQAEIEDELLRQLAAIVADIYMSEHKPKDSASE